MSVFNLGKDSKKKPEISQTSIYRLFILMACYLGLVALLFNSPSEILNGQLKILTSPSNLITDYFALVGVGPTLFNSALMLIHALIVVKLTRAEINGPILAAILTVAGFSLFGKNLYNSMPIVIGAFAYAKLTLIPSKRSLLAALFGTALGPLVSEITFNMNLPILFGIFFGCLAGFLAGFMLTPIAQHAISFTKGFSLYNVGFTCGLIGTLFTSVLRAMGNEIEPVTLYSSGYNLHFGIILCFLFSLMLLYGLSLNSWSFHGYGRLLQHSGQLTDDFMEEEGFSLALINMSLLGFISVAYPIALGGQLNGPVIGGILTVVGFGAFGKHPRNVIPVLMGVTLMGYVNSFDMSLTSVIIAGLFGTTVAPIAGRYGVLIGILAGAIHFTIVGNTSYLHGGINLYNNGFAGGIVAAIMIPLLEAVDYHHKLKKVREGVNPADVIQTED